MGSSSNESNSLIVCNMKYLAILAMLFSPSWPPSPKPRLMPKPLPPTTVDTMAVAADTADTTVTDTADTVVLTDTVVTTTARGLLMPNPKQRLMPMLPPHTTVDTTDTVDTGVDTDMVDTVVDTDTVPDTTAVDTDTDTAVDTDTVMAVNLNIKLHSVATRGPLR